MGYSLGVKALVFDTKDKGSSPFTLIKKECGEKKFIMINIKEIYLKI